MILKKQKLKARYEMGMSSQQLSMQSQELQQKRRGQLFHKSQPLNLSCE